MDLKAGTELTCHYMIDMGEAATVDSLQWYVDLWDKFSFANGGQDDQDANRLDKS